MFKIVTRVTPIRVQTMAFAILISVQLEHIPAILVSVIQAILAPSVKQVKINSFVYLIVKKVYFMRYSLL